MKHLILWPFWAFLDRNGRPSTSKCMAWAILAVQARGHQVPTIVCGMLLATAFGYTAWKDFMNKSTFATTATDALSLTAGLTKTVTETVAHSTTTPGAQLPKDGVP